MIKTMMMLIYGFLLILVTVLVKRNNRAKSVNLYSGFLFSISVYYILVPLVAYSFQEDLVRKYPNLEHELFNQNISMLLPVLLIIVTIFSFCFGYIRANRNPKNGVILQSKISNLSSIKRISGFSFIVGFLSFTLFIIGFGSLTNAFRYAEISRSFSVSLADLMDYRLSLLFIPARLITVAPFLYYYLMKNSNKRRYRIFFVVSFAVSILFLLFNAGKAPLLLFVLPFVYIFLNKFTKNTWKLIISLGIIGAPLLVIVDQLFLFIANGYWSFKRIELIDILYSFIFPFRNVSNSVRIVNEYGLRFFVDFITGPLNLLPGVNFEKSYEITSMFYNGVSWKVVGGVPNDIIMFGFIQFGLIGVIIISFAIGWFFGKIDFHLVALNKGIARDLISSVLIVSTFSIVSSADIEPFLRSNFILIIIPFALLRYSESNKRRRKKKNEISVYYQ